MILLTVFRYCFLPPQKKKEPCFFFLVSELGICIKGSVVVVMIMGVETIQKTSPFLLLFFVSTQYPPNTIALTLTLTLILNLTQP